MASIEDDKATFMKNLPKSGLIGNANFRRNVLNWKEERYWRHSRYVDGGRQACSGPWPRRLGRSVGARSVMTIDHKYTIVEIWNCPGIARSFVRS